MSNFFSLINSNFHLGNGQHINGINLDISKRGDIVCLLGPSGSGKTTILRTIAGLEKLKFGKILLNGNIISSEKKHVSPEKRNIALSFQDNCLFPHKNVIMGGNS